VGAATGISTLTATAEGLAGSPVIFSARVEILYASLAAGGGGEHTCALGINGVVYCWGDNRDGQLGDGTFTNRSSPVPARGGMIFKQVVVGVSHTCALTSDGSVDCWGKGMGGLSTGGRAFRLLAGGGDGHVCGIGTDGIGYCWGSNAFGQLGDSTTIDRPSPVRVLLPNTGRSFSMIAEGSTHTCGTLSGANPPMVCWGNNESGQIGDGTNTNRLTPTEVGLYVSFGIAGTAAGSRHPCGVASSSGAVYCWGGNESGQLGDGSTTNRPIPGSNVNVNGLRVTELVAGGAHTCVYGRFAGGTGEAATFCWGNNEVGQLGDGTQTNRTRPATVVGGPFVLKDLLAGNRHTCGLTQEGEVFCWGYNGLGALGNGTTTSSSTPVPARFP
jgi:alpha-tubulin suppressor-like RCC1 family protein